MPGIPGSCDADAGRTGGKGRKSVRWDIDEKIYERWKNFCRENGRPVQQETEKALSWWMELPPSMRERLDLR
jgi:hypothetical protein